MHPAYSVIVFTTASGAGYGLLFWLSLALGLGFGPDARWLSFSGVALALALITIGLLSSTLHLGHPERAIGAFSQWRSSWLSREGVAAVLTYIPSGLLALIWMLGLEGMPIEILAWLSAIGAVVTVYCTGMIYGSLRTIRQWYLGVVPVIYLVLAASTGALLFGFLLAIFGEAPIWAMYLALASTAVAALLKMVYWRRIDSDPGKYTAEMATGLKTGGGVRTLDPPHTKPNFVMREMGYSVARKHAAKLRKMVVLWLFCVPAACLLVAYITGWLAVTFGLAVAASALGVFLERWLFFAEAEHVSQLYYGATRA